MKVRTVLQFTAFVILFVFTTQALSQEHARKEGDHQTIEALSGKDIAAINKLLDTFAKDYEANNLDGVMAAFAEHAVYLEGRGIDDGKKAIRDDHLAHHFKSSTYLQYKSRDRIIKGQGEIAYVYQIVTVQSKRKTSDTPGEARDRRVLYILEMQTDGSWLIVLMK